MKVLIISHTSMCTRNNMGKTLAALFSGFEKSELCHLYIQPMEPDVDKCDSYYRITDTDALKSLFHGKNTKVGESFVWEQICTGHDTLSTGVSVKQKVYSLGRRRTSFIYMVRNVIWRISKWYSEELRQWISKCAPDVIFFASGDYAFAYEIAYTISKDFDIPMVMYCCDDYYINRLNQNSVLSMLVYKGLMKRVHRCMSRTEKLVTICDKMSDAYRQLFDKPIHTIYTGYTKKGVENPDSEGIVYLGNLGFSRQKSLVDIGHALKRISEKTGKQYHLDVYSAETREEVLRELTEENGIVFHGAVGSDEVNAIIARSQLVVHVESFKPENVRKVQYSISTKIADLLASGHCILAYGPDNVASIEYLRENNAACVVSDREKLESELETLLTDREKRRQIIQSAELLAEKNHNSQMVAQRVAEIISSCVKGKT